MSLYIHFLEAMCLIPRPRCPPRLPLPCLPVPTGVENLALDGRHRRSHPRGPTHIAHSQGPERPAGPPPPPRPQASLPPVEAARRPARKNKRDKQEVRAPAVATDTPAGGPPSPSPATARPAEQTGATISVSAGKRNAFAHLASPFFFRGAWHGPSCGDVCAGCWERVGHARWGSGAVLLLAFLLALAFFVNWRTGTKRKRVSCGSVWGTRTGHRGPERQMLRGPGHTATATLHTHCFLWLRLCRASLSVSLPIVSQPPT